MVQINTETSPSMLGHYDAGFTLRTDTHTSTKAQEEAANAMGQLISAHL